MDNHNDEFLQRIENTKWTVMKLIGNINPIGGSYHDETVMENLRVMGIIAGELLYQIDDIGYRYGESKEYSVKKNGEYANHFMDSIGKDNCPECNR